MSKQSIFKILKFVGSLSLSAVIIYFLFKNQDPVKLLQEIQMVDGKWVFFSMEFGSWAIVKRGLRWIVLIDALGYTS